MIAVGVLLVIAALRIVLRRGTVVRLASALAVHLPWFGRADDTFTTRLALAPTSRIARIIATANRRDIDAIAAGIRLLAAAATSVPLATLAFLIAGPLAAALIAISSLVLAARLPDIALAHAARTATHRARGQTAATIDTLAATIASGLALPEAMILTAAHAPPPVAATLRAAAIRRATGEGPRAALQIESRRFGVPRLTAVADAIDRQRRLGVPLGRELAAIATRLRHDQRAAALQRAARRAPLGTLIIALVITPACLTAVLACLVGGLLQGGTLPLK